jgi:hypothetical protein
MTMDGNSNSVTKTSKKARQKCHYCKHALPMVGCHCNCACHDPAKGWIWCDSECRQEDHALNSRRAAKSPSPVVLLPGALSDRVDKLEVEVLKLQQRLLELRLELRLESRKETGA